MVEFLTRNINNFMKPYLVNDFLRAIIKNRNKIFASNEKILVLYYLI